MLPGDGDYDRARSVWNGAVDHRPQAIVRCAGVADVLVALELARRTGLPLGVRGGGHNIFGSAVPPGGVVVDLSLLRSVRVDPRARTARVDPGARVGDVDRECQAFGLALPVGISGDTGVAGLTLGGGYGWLGPRFGLTCDNLLSADLVTADGDLQRASEEENPDLFWAIRGGGGNFGIATSFEYRLHPVGRVIAGVVLYRAADARDVLRGYRDAIAEAPDELLAHAGLVADEDGNATTLVTACWSGEDLAAGNAAVEPFRRLAEPVANHLGETDYVTMQGAFDAGQPAGAEYAED